MFDVNSVDGLWEEEGTVESSVEVDGVETDPRDVCDVCITQGLS